MLQHTWAEMSKLCKILSSLLSFHLTQHHLLYEHCMQLAIPATLELIQDFKKAKQGGETQLKFFMDELIYSKEKSIHDCIKWNSHLLFAEITLQKASGGSLKMKQRKMERRTLASVVNLFDVSSLLSTSELVKHCISGKLNCQFGKTPSVRSRFTQWVRIVWTWQLGIPHKTVASARERLNYHDMYLRTCSYAALRLSGNSDSVVIDTEDTDVYIQVAASSHNIPGILSIVL